MDLEEALTHIHVLDNSVIQVLRIVENLLVQVFLGPSSGDEKVGCVHDWCCSCAPG